MRLFKTTYIKLATCAAIFAGASYASLLVSNISNPPTTIIASKMPPNTIISLGVTKENIEILKRETKTDAEGVAKIEIFPNEVNTDKADALAYNLKISPSQEDLLKNTLESVKALDLSLSVHKNMDKVSVSGTGLDGFSNIFIANNKQNLETKADWSGLFSEDVDLTTDKAIELAFQGQNLSNDALLGQMGKVEVFFGDSSRDGAGTVEANYVSALKRMSVQLTAVMVQQTLAIGTFFDAEMQLQTQRKIQELQARAHKDYHPSEQMCYFGTFVRSVAHSESKAEIDKAAMNKILINSYLSVEGTSTETGESSASVARIEQFKTKYCDPRDLNNGLDLMCPTRTGALTAAERNRINKDVDYTRTFDSKLTLDIDFIDNALTQEEEDIVALARNLYVPEAFFNASPDNIEKDPRGHYKSRSYAAKMGIAHNSFVNIMGMKSSAPEGNPTTPIASLPVLPQQMRVNPGSPNQRVVPPFTAKTVLAEDAGWAYMKAMLREFNIPDEPDAFDVDTPPTSGNSDAEINRLLGERPSYYAQMEVLTKKIYQNPRFYTNLYDKPTNVSRIGVAIDAIALMNLRDRYDSLLRREMLSAILVEQALQPHVEKISAQIYQAMQTPQQ